MGGRGPLSPIFEFLVFLHFAVAKLLNSVIRRMMEGGHYRQFFELLFKSWDLLAPSRKNADGLPKLGRLDPVSICAMGVGRGLGLGKTCSKAPARYWNTTGHSIC